MGNASIVSSTSENARPKRMTSPSYWKPNKRRFSSGPALRSDAKMNTTQRPSGVHRAFIALGSNVGDRVEMIERACLEMDRANIKVKRTSSLFETTPMYVLDQDPFMNGVCEVIIPMVDLLR